MQEKFTRQAKAALKLAEDAARSWKHSYIGTEHILVGLLDEQEGTAGKILGEFVSTPAAARTALYNFWIFTPIVHRSLVPTQSVSLSIARSRCSVPARSSFCFSASLTACSLTFCALGL